MAQARTFQIKEKIPMDHSRAYQILKINSKFAIHLTPSSSYDELSSSKKKLIQTIWEQEQKRRGGKLHEGAILSAIAYDNKSLTGQFVPYKYFLAQLFDPSLKRDLKIIPVSLSGITLVGDNLIVAKRAWWVAEYPDCYELAPSGGIRPPNAEQGFVDMKGQLLSELEDEVGIETSFVKTVRFFSLVRDNKSDGVELLAKIVVKPCAILSSSSEYTQILTVPLCEVESFAEAHAKEFVPLSLEMLRLRKLTK
jgi:hypothetical protein